MRGFILVINKYRHFLESVFKPPVSARGITFRLKRLYELIQRQRIYGVDWYWPKSTRVSIDWPPPFILFASSPSDTIVSTTRKVTGPVALTLKVIATNVLKVLIFKKPRTIPHR